MATSPRSHYDELGVRPNAIPTEIERAWRAYRAEVDRPSAAPDRAREGRMKAAYETLSDPVKRAAYDDSLRAPRRREVPKGVWIALAAVVVLAAVGGAASLWQPAPAPLPGALPIEEITQAASQAMARVESVDMSGKSSRIGLAFALREGVMATACDGINPMAQLSLKMVGRTELAKVAQVDEARGLCKLTAKDVGGWPLTISGTEPRPGATVYVTKMNAVGEVSLAEAKVKRVVSGPRGKTIELSVAALPERHGGPVLDARGHVVGIQVVPAGAAAGEVVKLRPDDASEAPPGDKR